jgi:hypothetical protein
MIKKVILGCTQGRGKFFELLIMINLEMSTKSDKKDEQRSKVGTFFSCRSEDLQIKLQRREKCAKNSFLQIVKEF